MKLSELLTEDRIEIPLRAGSVGEALRLLMPEGEAVGWTAADGSALVGRLRSGEGGVARRVSPSALILSLRASEGDEPWAALGVSGTPLVFDDESSGSSETPPGPKILLILRLPKKPGFGAGSLEMLTASLSDPGVLSALLTASGPTEILEVDGLVATDLAEPLRVDHVLQELSYRVFPDTPIHEVVGLMARRGLRSLPVVGKDLQVVGIVTAGDALRYALERAGRHAEESAGAGTGLAREIMSRTVMCVSEGQELADAARLMVNRDVSQLPVVREGEIVGMLTRDAVLKALFEDV